VVLLPMHGEQRMKKVTLLVPDKIEHVIGSSRSRRCSSVEVTPATIKRALCDRSDYHSYFYFECADEVDVISIVDYEVGYFH
jgi:hypothetical protein